MGIKFMRASVEDVDRLIEVQNKSFYSDYVKYGECPGYNHSKESMKNIVLEKIAYKIICDNQVVGDIIVKDNGDNTYYLACLCVIPDYENRKIGQAAIRFLENEFSNATKWTLETPADKYRNHYFYTKMGFIATKDYLAGSIQVVLFEKKVNHT